MVEQWIDISGYEGCYQISNMGHVRTLLDSPRLKKLQVMQASTNAAGYHVVTLYKNKLARSYRVHRLVLSAFKPVQGYPNLEVNHINGVKTDNRLINLEWASHTENMRHAIEILKVSGAQKGERNSRAKLTEDDIRQIRHLYETGVGAVELATKFSVGRRAITKIVCKTRWGHVK